MFNEMSTIRPYNYMNLHTSLIVLEWMVVTSFYSFIVRGQFYHVVCKVKNFKVSQGIQTLHNLYCILQMHNSTQLLNFLVDL